MARTRALDYDAKRKIILHRSAELFAQHGYATTSITMIADACGTSKALLYHYYPDKEAVLFDVISTHLRDLIATATKTAAGPAAAEVRLHALAQALLESYRDADAEHQVQIANLGRLTQERQDILRAMERELVAVFSAAIAAAVPSVGDGPLLKPLTMSMFGMLNWQYLWFHENKGLSRSEYARFVTGLILSGAAGAVGEVTPAPAALPAKSRRRAAVAV